MTDAERAAIRDSVRDESLARGTLRDRFNRTVGEWFMDRTGSTVLFDWSDDLYELVAPFFQEQVVTEPSEVRTNKTHCPCCGAFRAWCVCWSNSTYDWSTGKSRAESCSPDKHGRKGYGFDD